MRDNLSGLFVLFFVFVAFAGAGVAQDSGPALPPHEVYGEITYSDGDVASQVDVTAEIDGDVIDSSVTGSSGEYVVRVPSDYSGENFTVNAGDSQESFTAEVGASERYDIEVADSVGGSDKFSVSLDDEEVDEFSSVDLTPEVSDAGSDPSYTWSIVDDPTGGVSLDNEDEETVTFNAPSVGFDRNVAIEVEVEKSSGNTKKATADVTIVDTSSEETGSGDQQSDDQQSDQQDQRPETKQVQAEVTEDPETGRTTAQAQVDNVEENQKVEVNIPDSTEGEESTVESVSFTSSSSSDSVSVSVSDIGVERPEEVTEDAGSDVYSYQEINVDGVTDEDITESSVTFKVKKSYLEERDRPAEDVVMKRYNGGWQELDTRIDEELENTIRFEASSTGFSYYAIALREQETEEFTEASIGVTSMNVTPQTGTPPFDVEVQVEVENTGNASGSENITVVSGNETIGSEVVELEAGSWTALSFDYTIESKGDLEFSAGDQSVTVSSEPKGISWIGVLAIILALLAGGYFRREDIKERLGTDTGDDSDDSDKQDEGNLEYTCDECGSSFDSETGLHIHQGEVHGDDEE